MYQNKVTLTGFLGSDPELRNSGLGCFTALCVATKSSYRKDDAYVSHTEWHRCVVFGKLSNFAATLKKGTHLQVEGELRSREYVNPKTGSTQRVWEIRVAAILKLARAGKTNSQEQQAWNRRRRRRPHRPTLKLSKARLRAGLRWLGGHCHEIRINRLFSSPD